MSAINVNSITGRTGGHGPVLTGVTTVSDGNLFVIGTGSSIGIGTEAPEEYLNIFASTGTDAAIQLQTTTIDVNKARISKENTGELKITSSLGSSGRAIVFETKGSDQNERMRIKANGEVGIGTDSTSEILTVAGNVRVENSADATQYLTVTYQGVNFQSTGAGSSTTATGSLLDDYEEGNWTPTFYGGTTTGTYTFTSDSWYFKIGRMVTAYAVLANITTSSAGSGDLLIGGLPFTGSNNNSLGSIVMDKFDLDPATGGVAAVLVSGGSAISIRETRDSLTDRVMQVTDKNSDGSDIFVQICYKAAA